MKSISVSEYKQFCADYIGAALQRPSMFFQSLQDLEAMMSGHAEAFRQIGALTRDDTFNCQFANWLYERKGVSTASGWAYAITHLIKLDEENATSWFASAFGEFMKEWTEGIVS